MPLKSPSMGVQGSKTSELQLGLQPVFSLARQARRRGAEGGGSSTAGPRLQPLNPHVFERLPNPNLLTAESSSEDDESPSWPRQQQAQHGISAARRHLQGRSAGSRLPLSSDRGPMHPPHRSHQAAQDAQLMNQVSSASSIPSWPAPESPQRPVPHGTRIGGAPAWGRSGAAHPGLYAPALLAMDAAPGSLSALNAPFGQPLSPEPQRQAIPPPTQRRPVQQPAPPPDGALGGMPGAGKDRGGGGRVQAALGGLKCGGALQLPEHAIVAQALLALQVAPAILDC